MDVCTSKTGTEDDCTKKSGIEERLEMQEIVELGCGGEIR